MLVGVDASDSVVETIKGQRLMAIVGGLLLGTIFVIGLSQLSLGAVVGLDTANASGNIPALADILFGRYVFAFEVDQRPADHGGGRRDGAGPPRAPRAQADAGRAWPPSGCRTTPTPASTSAPLPTPGVFARHNAVDTPALLPDGTAAEASVSRVLAARGTVRSAPAMADDIAAIEQQIAGAHHAGRDVSAPATTEEEAPAT